MKIRGNTVGTNMSVNAVAARASIEGVIYSPNLLPADYYDGEYKEHNGITYEKQADGTVIANGTATATARYYIVQDMPIKAGTYRLSGFPEGTTSGRLLHRKIGAGNWLYFSSLTSANSKISITEDTTISIRLEYSTNNVAENHVWKPMLEEGDAVHDFTSPNTVLGDMQKAISGHTEQISAMQTAVDNLDVRITELYQDAKETIGFAIGGIDSSTGVFHDTGGYRKFIATPNTVVFDMDVTFKVDPGYILYTYDYENGVYSGKYSSWTKEILIPANTEKKYSLFLQDASARVEVTDVHELLDHLTVVGLPNGGLLGDLLGCMVDENTTWED